MTRRTVPEGERVPAWLGGLGVALAALRLFHLGGPLDDPHSWRQCDTAHYSLDFARHGIDLLHPAVCWLGSHRVLIFEFPLPEALSALLQRAFGPGVVWDRVVALAFFLLATGYFLAIARLVAGRRAAALATLAWLALPLGQYYSRAAHVDFAATAFAHALLYHALRAMRGRSLPHALAAAAGGALAAMIKAPYVLPLLPPLALAWLAAPGLAAAALAALPLAGTALAFALWRRHVDAVNGAAPDWSFLPGYYKEVNPVWWYFGDLAQRLRAAGWVRIGQRMLHEVLTPAGVLLAAAGMALRAAAAPRPGPRAFAVAWALGTLVFLLVFFPLNVIHDYYQIPFLAPAALFAGLGLDALWRRPPLGALALLVFVAVAVGHVRVPRYYRVDWLRVEAGAAIAARVPPGDLVAVSDHGSEYSDPRLLFRADREGWALRMQDLTPPLLARLAGLGARWLAVVTDPEYPGLAPPAFLAPARTARVPVTHAGRTLGTLELYDLRRGPAGAGGR